MDDATHHVYEALWVPEENSWTVMRVQGGPPDRSHPSQVGRALGQLGIERILARWTHGPRRRLQDSGARVRRSVCAILQMAPLPPGAAMASSPFFARRVCRTGKVSGAGVRRVRPVRIGPAAG